MSRKDRSAAFDKALEWGDRIPIGVICRNDRPLFEDYLGVTGKVPPVDQKADPLQFGSLVDEFK